MTAGLATCIKHVNDILAISNIHIRTITAKRCMTQIHVEGIHFGKRNLLDLARKRAICASING